MATQNVCWGIKILLHLLDAARQTYIRIYMLSIGGKELEEYEKQEQTPSHVRARACGKLAFVGCLLAWRQI